MLDWEHLRYLVALGHSGSLSVAARALKVDHATVSRRLAALELALGARLVERLPRATPLTAVGQQVLVLANEMQSRVHAIERLAQAQQGALTGRVTLSAPPVLASQFFAGLVQAFHAQHPGICLAILSQAQQISLSRREADLAVRLVRPQDASNVARKLGQLACGLYASCDYAQAQQPSAWQFIAYEESLADTALQRWIVAAAAGRPVVCEVSDIVSQHMACRSGVGVTALPQFIGDADTGLQRLPFDGPAFAPELWLVLHADLQNAAPVRAVADFVVDATQRFRQ